MAIADKGPAGARIIVLGNEKGGSGKSTTAMHLIVGLLGHGLKVAALDLDPRQRSLTRYLENRRRYAQSAGLRLAIPGLETITPTVAATRAAAEAEERDRLKAALEDLCATHDVVVADCPGSDTHLSRLAHAHADTLITPVNDSFVDVDLLARVDPDTHAVLGPSLYAEMVWAARKRRAAEGRAPIDWVVMRNRVAAVNARNKERVERVLAGLARRIGFRFIPGLSERVIYRELFLKGLTLGDFGGGTAPAGGLTMSHVAARQELRRLIEAVEPSIRRSRTAAA